MYTCIDVIFGDYRLKGLGVARGRISGFPTDLRRRSLQHSRTTVRVCDNIVNVFS